MKRSILAVALAATFIPTLSIAAAPVVTKLWTTNHGVSGLNTGVTSEISAFDSSTNTLWVAGVVGVDVLNASTGVLVQHIAASGINSVAIKNGVAAFAVENSVRNTPGTVRFYDTSSRTLTGSVTVGALPDMLTFTPDGSKLLVANEATPNPAADLAYTAPDPAGTVSIIDMNTRTVAATAGFAGVATSGSNLRTSATVGMDYEPEYITINAAGTKAFVGLQEANGMGVLDLNTNTFSQVIGLGVKDFNSAANAIDTSDQTNLTGTLLPVAVKGLYQPDGMAIFEKNGQTFIVMANEGDTREDNADKARAKDVYSGLPTDLKRLNISTTDSTAGNLVAFGARSFSIRAEDGSIVYDSGNILDAQAIAHGIYDDGRSDDKGVEPEGVTIMELDGRTLAFVGLERTKESAVAIFDITDPANSQYVDMIVGGDGDGIAEAGEDVSPEGVLAYSYGGKTYLAVAHEVSNTTTLYSIAAPVPEADTYALMLAGMGLVGLLARRRKVN